MSAQADFHDHLMSCSPGYREFVGRVLELGSDDESGLRYFADQWLATSREADDMPLWSAISFHEEMESWHS